MKTDKTRARDIRTLELALENADAVARSDVECYGKFRADGWCDTNGDHPDQYVTPESAAHEAHAATRAAEYIELRGDELPYNMTRHPQHPWLVRFQVRKS